MQALNQSLPARQPQDQPMRNHRSLLGAVAWVVLAGFGVVGLVSCGKPATEAKPVAAPMTKEPKPAPAGKTEVDLTEALAMLEPEPAKETPVSELEEEALRVMNLYPDKNAEELLNVPEVNPSLVKALQGLGADPQLQAYMNSSVDLAAKFKGLDGPPGSYKLNLDVKAYNDGRTQRMLAAVLSEKPGQVVQFLVEELGEASFEFTFTGADKTSNGISLDPAPTPPPTAPTNDPD
jgi:hypothetical protein